MTKIRVAWGITGAGDYLAESVSAMKQVSANLDVEVTVLVSKNAEMVVKWYRLWDDLKSSFEKVKLEKGANVPFIAGPLQVGTYRLFFVSPATANTVAKIAYGETTTYGALAAGIGRPKATRAVGQAVGANPVPIVIPCHRVIGTSGSLTGFGGGLPLKERLLALERGSLSL